MQADATDTAQNGNPPSQSPQGEPAEVSGDPGRSSEVELEVYLRIGGEWRHLYGLWSQASESLEVQAGNDRELVLGYREAVETIDDATMGLAHEARLQFRERE